MCSIGVGLDGKKWLEYKRDWFQKRLINSGPLISKVGGRPWTERGANL